MRELADVNGYLFDLSVQLVRIGARGVLLIRDAGINPLRVRAEQSQLLANMIVKFTGDAAAFLFLRGDQPSAQFAQRAFRLASFGHVQLHAYHFSNVVIRPKKRATRPPPAIELLYRGGSDG